MPHRLRPSPLRLLAQAVLTTVAVATGGLLTMGSAGLAEVSDGAVGRPGVERTAPASTPETRLMKRYGCSTTGFAPDTVPRSAIVRGPDGRVRAVSFERGWAVYTAGDAAGAVLVAVCLRPVR